MEERKLQESISAAKNLADKIITSIESDDLCNETCTPPNDIIEDIDFQNSVDVEKALRRVHSRIDGSRGKRIPFRIYGAVASVLLVLGVSVGWMLWRHHERAAIEWAFAQPGIEKASVVTADSKVIELEENHLEVSGDRLVNTTGDGKKKLSIIVDKVPEFNKLVVPAGGEHNLALEDGTTVMVNSESTLLFPTHFTGGKRVVRLEGEAFFQVKSNPDEPFIVQLNGISIDVTGTSFNVHAYPDEDEINVALVNGHVNILNSAGTSIVSMEPGELFTYQKEDGLFENKKVDLEPLISWKDDIFVFRDEEIGDIIQTLSRWYNVSIQLDDNIRNTRYTGILSRKQSLIETLDALRMTGELDFHIHHNKKVDLLEKK